MPNIEQAKIAFVYSSVIAPGVMVGDPTPELAITCKEFPAETTLSVNFGVIGFNGIDNYSLDVKVLFNEQDVTAPPTGHKKIFSYLPRWGKSGDYVATMTLVESFTANEPGYYTIEAQLLYKDTTPDSLWETIDIKRSYFAVDSEWRTSIDG